MTNKPATVNKSPPGVSTCPACLGTHVSEKWPDLRIHVCNECGLGIAAWEVTSELYGEDYFEGAEYRSYKADRRSLDKNFARALRLVQTYQPSGRLLEIGCAYGYFLSQASSIYEATGVEIGAHAAELARTQAPQASVQCGDFLDLPAPPAPWDAVCMWDTIEHLAKPAETLEKIAGELAPGGVVFVTTGDFGSWLSRLQGRAWRQIHPPTHLFYFTRESFRRLFHRLGLEIVAFRYPGFCRSYHSIVDRLFHRDSPAARLLCQVATAGGRIDFPLTTNTFDYLQVIARKRTQ